MCRKFSVGALCFGNNCSSEMRVLFTIPKGKSQSSMPFVERSYNSLRSIGLSVDKYYLVTSFRPRYFVSQALYIRQATKSYDVVHAQYGTYTGLLTSLFSRCTVLVTFRGSDLNYVRNENRLKWILQMTASHISAFLADACICVSNDLRRKIAYKRNVYIVPSSIDLGQFIPVPMMRARKELSLNLEKKYILFCEGNNPILKGIELAQKVRSIIEKKCSDIELIIIPNVDSQRLALYFNAVNCLIFLSNSEGSPNLIKESLACGLPVVSVDVGDVKEVIGLTRHSRIVNRNEYEIADAAIFMCETSQRENVRCELSKYSGNTIAGELVEIYKSTNDS